MQNVICISCGNSWDQEIPKDINPNPLHYITCPNCNLEGTALIKGANDA